MTIKPIALTVPDAVDYSGLSRSSIYEAMKCGALPARKAGRRTLIRYEDLEAFLANMPEYRPAA